MFSREEILAIVSVFSQLNFKTGQSKEIKMAETVVEKCKAFIEEPGRVNPEDLKKSVPVKKK